MNLASMLTHQARRRPRHPAIVDADGTTMSYAALDPLVRRTAAHLRALGAQEGDVIGVGLRDSAAHLICNYAVARIGAVILPLDWRWTEGEISRLMEFFDARLVLTEPDGPDLPGAVRVDDAWDAAVSDAPVGDGFPEDPDLPMVLSLSSGTTGRPKGPALTHRQFLARFHTQLVTLTFNEHDRYLSATPLYFGGGRSFTMSALYFGATVVMFPPPYEPEDLVRAATEHQATTMLLVPTLLRRLLAIHDDGAPPLLGGLRLLLSTGAILHPEERADVVAKLCPGFINYYGSTEGGGVSVLMPSDGAEQGASVGRAVFATDVEIVDGEDLPLAAGEMGRIRYRGPGCADGFFRDPDATKESFRDGWFYPGDLGRLDADGYLYLTGRDKDVIIRGGANIYPAEIEEILLAHKAVSDAVVVGTKSEELGEDIAAFVVSAGDTTEADLRAHCKERLASYKVPRVIRFLDAFPKDSLGKVKKAELASTL